MRRGESNKWHKKISKHILRKTEGKPVDNLDVELAKIQKSTRTSSGFLAPLHDRLRMKYPWYYQWHLWKYTQLAHTVILVFYMLGVSMVSVSMMNKDVEYAHAATVTYLTAASGSWTVPADWNNSDNIIEAIGCGGSGDGAGGYGGGGGGGGAYAKVTNLSLTPSSSVSYVVGQGGVACTTKTQFKDSSTLVADYGDSATNNNGVGGGSVADSVGAAARYKGGDGANAGTLSGGGAGGAAGPNGAGGNGTAGGFGTGGPGGAGDNGSGGAGGGAGANGSAGTEWTTKGCGGGGGGANNGGNGGNGGNYGAGGGGAAQGEDYTGGQGTAGLIVITYTAATVPATPSISSPTNNATDVSVNPTITSSAYSGDGSHVSSDWEVYPNVGLTGRVWLKNDDSTNKTSIVVNETNGTFEGALSGQTALGDETDYWVRVRHTNSVGDSSWSSAIKFTTESGATPPIAPSDVTADTISTTGFTAHWTDNASDETGFKVYISTSAASSCADATYGESPDYTPAADATSQEVGSKAVNTQYCVKVLATNATGDSDAVYSSPLYTLANAPSVSAVDATSATSLTVTIDVNSNPAATEFAISCDTDTTFLNHTTNACEAIADDADHWRTYANWGGASGFVDTGLSVNTQHTYKVMARNGDETATSLSDGASKYTLANVPSAPTVNATSTTSLTIIIDVNSNPAATEFAISCDSDTTFLNHTTNACEALANDADHWRTYANWGGASGFVDTGLSVNTQYTYKVEARNGDNTATALSSATNQTTQANPNDPSSLGGASYVDGSWQTDDTPTLSFTLTDPNEAATVKYQIVISENSDYSSPIIDYTSALAAQGARSFTVGQAVGDGTYTTGGAVTDLPDGTYYWRVKNINNSSAESDWVAPGVAGTVDIKVDTSLPTTDIYLDPADPNGSNSYYKTTAPTITFTSDDGSGSGASTIYYRWGASGDYSAYSTGITAPEGTNTIYYYGTDLVGNTGSGSPVTREIKVDTVTPTATATADPVGPNGSNNYYTGTAPTITLSSSDTTSGLASIQYKWDSGDYATYSTPLEASEGTHTLYYYAIDNAGNTGSGSPSSTTYYVDLSAPEISAVADPVTPNGNSSYYIGTAPSITLSAEDPYSGIETIYYKWDSADYAAYSTPLTASEGTHTLYYYGTDSSGNSSTPANQVFKVDTIMPVTNIAASPSSADGDNSYYKTVPSITLSATDANDVSGIYYRWGASGDYSTYSTAFNAPEGTNTLYYYGVDVPGNSQLSTVITREYKVDTTQPTAAHEASPASPNGSNGYYINSAPQITLSALDTDGSGVASIKYKWDDGVYSTYSSALTAPENTHTLYYYSTDNAGVNSIEHSQQFKVDLNLPTTDIYLDPADPNGSNSYYKTTAPTITFTSADGSGSGASTIYYRWGAEGEYSSYSSAITAPEGINTLYYYGTDLAGNTGASSPATREVKVDITNADPTATADPASPNGSDDYYTGSAPSITLSATDTGGSGVAATYYKWDSGSYAAYSTALTAPEGSHTLYYYSVDNAGNSGLISAESTTYKVDTIAAASSIALSPSAASGTNSYYISAPTITLSGTDAGSGVAGLYYRWGASGDYSAYSTTINAPEGTNTLYYYATDNAGNSGADSPTTREVKVDSVHPSVSSAVSPEDPDGAGGYYMEAAPEVTLSGADTGSGVGSIKYRWGTTGDFSTYSSVLTAPEGINTLAFYSVDNAGNESSVSNLSLQVDLSAPAMASITPTATSPTNSLVVPFTWSAAVENGSGVAIYYVYIGTTSGGTDLVNGAETTTASYSYTFSSAGQYYIKVRARDNVGLLGSMSEVGSVLIDQTNPILTITNLVDNTFISASSITLLGTATDTISGIDRVMLKIDDGEWVAAASSDDFTNWSYDWSGYSETAHTIIAKALDRAGNEITSTAFHVIVDVGAPTSPADLRVFNISGGTFGTYAVYLDFNESIDTGSGVTGYEVYRGGTKIADVPTPKDSSNSYYSGSETQPYFLVDSAVSNGSYDYLVKATDAVGNVSQTSTVTVNTSGQQLTSNVISEPKGTASTIVTKSKTAAIISWKTTYPSTSYVEYGTTTNYGSKTETDSSLNQGHNVLLEGLKPGTTYHAKAVSKDVYGRETASEDIAFTTKVAADDKTLLQVIINAFQNLFKTISVNKIQAADSVDALELQEVGDNVVLTDLSFGTKSIYRFAVAYPKGSTLLRSTDGANYSTVSASAGYYIDNNVSAASNYYYKVSGGEAVSRKPLFGSDVPLAVAGQDIVKDSVFTTKDKAQIAVKWNTNRGATSQVEFGATTQYGQKTKEDASLNVGHYVLLEGLDLNTTYHFRVTSRDTSGNVVTSDDFTYQTPSFAEKTTLDIIIESLQRTISAFKFNRN